MNDKYTPKDLNQLGDDYFYGKKQEKNIELAYTYYKKAADMNNPVGIYNVGKYYLEKEDYKKAYQHFKKATDLDYTEAYITLYEMYMDGTGIRKSKKKAFKALKSAADQHDATTYHLIGRMYEQGIGVGTDHDKAYEYYESSATKNNAEGMYYIALFLLNKKNKHNEYETAFYWLDKAANMHHKLSIRKLIELYQSSHEYVNNRSLLYLEEMAFYYQELLAKTKDIESLKIVAKAYEEGRTFLTINYSKAFDYYKLLHEHDEVLGYLGLGKCYLYGLGVEQNYDLAKDYLDLASSRNNSEAKNLLGDIYRHGYGVNADFEIAKSYYLGAAENEFVDGLINLSLLHYRQQIKNPSPSQAITYINRAVEQDSPKAYFWLALYYELGIGTDKNLQSSIDAYKKAIQLGNNASRYKLANVLYKNIKRNPLSKRKTDMVFNEVKTLLMTYIEAVDGDNRLKAMYLLGDLYKEDLFSKHSDKTSRYYYEVSAENGYVKAMNRMYEIYQDEDFEAALSWLKKACETPSDGEELYLLALLYEKGNKYINKDLVKTDKLLVQSSNLNYSKATEKLMINGKEDMNEH
ncbi:MAG: tetratricopeptide repeat protein [Tenericutes bacterium]|jgi:TPR repeat protein|nr:tetratricopeptide repeat protein [Mycoplasmatota bacterium]